MIEKQVLVKNLTINYKTFGNPESKPFLVLHGWPSKSDTWQKVAEELEKTHFVIVPDLPGFGKSQEPLETWTLDTYVEWLREFTEKFPQLSRSFTLLGHSFGGALAAKFTIKYNQNVEKLFLVSAACIRSNQTQKSTINRFAKVVKLFSFLPYYPLLRKGFYKYVLKSDYPHVSGIMRETYLKVIADDLSQKLYFIKVPTIIIWGQKDDLTPFTQAEFIHAKIEGSKLLVIPEAKHGLQLTNPELLSQHILLNL